MNWFEKGGRPKPDNLARWCESGCDGIEVDLASLVNGDESQFTIMEMIKISIKISKYIYI